MELTIYDMLGQRIRTLVAGSLRAGPHVATWDGRTDDNRAVAAGVYLYRLSLPPGSGGEAGFTRVRKLTLLE